MREHCSRFLSPYRRTCSRRCSNYQPPKFTHHTEERRASHVKKRRSTVATNPYSTGKHTQGRHTIRRHDETLCINIDKLAFRHRAQLQLCLCRRIDECVNLDRSVSMGVRMACVTYVRAPVLLQLSAITLVLALRITRTTHRKFYRGSRLAHGTGGRARRHSSVKCREYSSSQCSRRRPPKLVHHMEGSQAQRSGGG